MTTKTKDIFVVIAIFGSIGIGIALLYYFHLEHTQTNNSPANPGTPSQPLSIPHTTTVNLLSTPSLTDNSGTPLDLGAQLSLLTNIPEGGGFNIAAN